MELDGHEYLTIKEFLQRYPGISANTMRTWVGDRHKNGLAKALYALHKRQLYIRPDQFFQWLESRRSDHLGE